MKKVLVFGGGTGMSYLLRGLKQYPLDITAVVSVCDDGGSAGRLRDEFDTVAMGDLRRVLVAMSNEESTLDKVFNYRFTKGSLKGHTVGNIFALRINSNVASTPFNILPSLSKTGKQELSSPLVLSTLYP